MKQFIFHYWFTQLDLAGLDEADSDLSSCSDMINNYLNFTHNIKCDLAIEYLSEESLECIFADIVTQIIFDKKYLLTY